MPNEIKKESLQECSDMELVILLMREACVGVDAGGHSGRSAEAQLIEAAFHLREPLVLDWAPDYNRGEMQSELVSRLTCTQSVQLAIPALGLLCIEDYICLCVEKVLELDSVSGIMAGYIDQIECISRLLRSSERFSAGFSAAQETEEIVREGRDRAFVYSMYLRDKKII